MIQTSVWMALILLLLQLGGARRAVRDQGLSVGETDTVWAELVRGA